MNKQIDERDYVVFSQRMAGYLMFKGCKLLKMCPNRDIPDKNVYYFPNTDEVLKHVKDYKLMEAE
ncbi:hypothetical protein GCM10028778_22560 [Barrientosiimonas marina]